MADSNTTSDTIKSRTIVGSPPHRRPLRGREAVERALAHARFWGADRVDAEQLWSEGHGVASKASEHAYEWHQTTLARVDAQPRWRSWLPVGVAELTAVELERLLAGLPIISYDDGADVTLDEVAP